ncbi:hypothetical protein HMPREF9136_0174 [Prevotella dentalis DSM 3688]|uniref:Uncharacterized protein n=1 Tax=Prevotella dentalis (strain ATCC 49559 / DSM 3688 / JCM 13448 / NCTC 12043 / ES 2772) TaxID=908937 RepID=F9CZZ7_PREDD|nr:hypothetical protein HMPREF9136_0174 [Prevotella dentalis DSM 3688]
MPIQFNHTRAKVIKSKRKAKCLPVKNPRRKNNPAVCAPFQIK